MKNRLVHDLSNILAIIQGHTRLIEKGLRKDQDVSAHIEGINAAVRRAADVLLSHHEK
jgi:DNA-binding FrmR family transcriptional regulator